LLVEAGLSAGEGISAGVLLNVGGIVGGLMLGYLSTRLPLRLLIGTYMIVTAIFMVLFSIYASNMTAALVLCLLIGFFLFGSMIGLYALVPGLYPASIRTTGMGWAIGIGRGGAVLSPLAAGILLDYQWQSTTLFWIFAIPLVISMVAVSAARK
jgi:MFS family permease